MFRCRDVGRLLYEYVERRLPPADRQAMDEHLEDCPACLAFLKTYRETIHLSRDVQEAEIPPELLVRLEAFLAARARRPRGWLDRWRRRFLMAGIVVASAAGAAAVCWGSTIFPSGRDVELTYRARLPALPAGAQDVQVWIPLAKTGAEQRILRREVRSPVPYTITQDPEYGNDLLHLTLPSSSPQPVEIAVDYHARLLGSAVAVSDPPPASAELPRYLEPQGLVIIDDEVRARARQAVAGKAALLAKARGIYDSVIQHVAYDKTTPGYGQGDTARACQVGKGNCTDFHSLFISMARAERIPSRFKIGFVIPPESSGTIPGYHCWAEFYAEGRGWVPVDASEAWKHPELSDHYFGARDPHRFLLNMGREIRLVPTPQNGPVNILFYPYVEVDGQPFSGVETEFRFRELTRRFARNR